MSWLFSQALVAEYSAGTSLDGAPCALWNGMPTQRASWLPDKMTDACLLSRSGMTFKPLTDDLGGGVLMSYLEAFPVRTFHAPGKVQESKAIEVPCGSTWRESSAKFNLATVVENSPMLVGRGLAVVLSDLAEMGYDARWGIVGAHHVSAPHKRDRIWVMANSNVHEHRTHGESPRKASEVPRQHRQERCPWRTSGTSGDSEILANSNVSQRERMRCPSGSEQKYADSMPFSAWWGRDPAETLESPVGRVAHGVASRVDRLKAIGNGQVPAVAQLAWETLNT